MANKIKEKTDVQVVLLRQLNELREKQLKLPVRDVKRYTKLSTAICDTAKTLLTYFLNKPLALGGNYEKPKNLSESKVELLPERINDTSKLAEVIPDNITVSEIAKRQKRQSCV